jgi:murein DD-endopeptidase MepM/ murein hydrolase activator NlpD
LSSRHYVGRHRPAHAAVDSKIRRAPKSLSAGFVLPTAAAAALVVTATGATMAEASGTATAAPRSAFGALVAPQVSEELKAQSEEARANASGVDDRRAAATSAEAALAGRQQETQRAARTRARVLAKAKAAAAAAAEKQAKAEAAARAHDWVMPVTGADFTSGFKFRWGRMHTGNDLAIAEGTPIVAMSTGEVIFAGWMGGGGNTTKIRYWDGTVSYYEHQSAILVNVGDQVAPGDLVGRVGNTGHSFGAHLHLEIHPADGGPIDPHPWMQEHGLSY